MTATVVAVSDTSAWVIARPLDASGPRHSIYVPQESFPPAHRNLTSIRPGMMIEVEDLYDDPRGRRAGRARRLDLDDEGTTDLTGTVVRLRPERGFGFIQTTHGEYFLHATDCDGLFESLHVGDHVLFDVGVRADGKLRAINLRF